MKNVLGLKNKDHQNVLDVASQAFMRSNNYREFERIRSWFEALSLVERTACWLYLIREGTQNLKLARAAHKVFCLKLADDLHSSGLPVEQLLENIEKIVETEGRNQT